MGRRVLAFFLGLLVGIVFVFGGLALAVYITVTTVKPNDVYPDSSKYLGDLADMTLYDMYKSISALYLEKVGVTDENGLYFTLGQFCEHYNINPNDLFGREVSQDVLDIPIFEFFAEDDKDPAMQQVKVSAFFALANMFSSGENGEGFFTQTMLDKLAAHNMSELLDDEKGFSYVFQEVLLVDVMPETFPSEKGDTPVMWAFGQSSVGRLMGGIDGNVMLEFKEGGAFEAMGALKMTEMLGNDSSLVTAMFNNYTFADLIDENGNVNIDGLLEAIYLGDLFEYLREQYDGDTEEFTLLFGDDNRAVLHKGEGDDEEFILRLPAAVEGEFDYYVATLACTIAEHEHNDDCFDQTDDAQASCGQGDHAHDEYCYGFIWYKCTPNSDDQHEHTDSCLATGMMAKLANERVSDLSSLSKTIMSFTMKDVMGDNVPASLKSIENTQLRDLQGAIDVMYLGNLLEYVRLTPDNLDDDYDDFGDADGIRYYQYLAGGATETLYVMRDDKDGIWYNARLDCANSRHTSSSHVKDCFEFIWYELKCELDEEHTNACYENGAIKGVMGKLASILIGDMSADSLTRAVNKTKLGEVMDTSINALLYELSDVRVGDLGEELNNLYVGTAMGYYRIEADGKITGSNDFVAVDRTTHVYKYVENGVTYYYIKDDRKNKYFNAQFTCVEKNDGKHTHNDDCYGYIWYQCTLENDHSEHKNNDCLEEVKGLNGKMANLSMEALGRGDLDGVLTSLTMRDLIDSGMITFEGEDSTYKFAIIFCNNASHSCADDTPSHKCTLAEYFIDSNTSNRTAKEFWLHTHGYADENSIDEIGKAHRDEWEDESLSDFMSSLLGAF